MASPATLDARVLRVPRREVAPARRSVRDGRGGPSRASAPNPLTGDELYLLGLQRTAGNAAVSAWLTARPSAHAPAVQRCGSTPCDCSLEERVAADEGHAGQESLPTVQRCGSTPCDCSPEERAAAEENQAGQDSFPSVQRSCGLTEVGKHDGCRPASQDAAAKVLTGLEMYLAKPYLFDWNCDTMASGEADRLRKDFKRGDVVNVHGFASIEGNARYNQDLSCARAEKAAALLADEVGVVVRETYAHGAIPGPKVPRRSVVIERAEAPKPAPPVEPADTCGPDIDAQLTAVLTEMQSYFRSLSPNWRKHRSCQELESPSFVMAWDINELFLPNTGWLRRLPYASVAPPCSQPQPAPGQNREDPQMCSNTVSVRGKCNLAGTVNYATFGIMMRECYDFYDGVPWYAALLRTQIPFFTEGAMRTLVWAYKRIADPDDPGPPTEFAEATYENGPSGRPDTENRSHCKAPCQVTAPVPPFTFVWEPYQQRSGGGR